ncbi:MAG: MarR family transcriptional regulator [Candidatus Thorarchaeota archaeon]|nr:MarR family transcriptional regulator [Candidatus Thorarchaeota archaeon]
MPEKVQIATVGKHETGRLQFVLYRKESDKLIMLHTETTRTQAESIKEKVETRLPVELVSVEPWDYHDVLGNALDAAYRNRACELRFNPSLGTRVMTSALIMAAMFTNSPVYLVKEEEGKPVDVVDVLPIRRTMLTQPKKNILNKLLSERDCVSSQRELGSRTSLAASTISGHVRDLEDAGYVNRSKGPEGNVICITDLGRIVLRVAQHWKEM